MILPVKEILEQFCKDYEQVLRYSDKEGKITKVCFITQAARTETANELYAGNAFITIDGMPVYREAFLHKDPETAIEKACFKLFQNLLFYGLGAAHKDLTESLNGNKGPITNFPLYVL